MQAICAGAEKNLQMNLPLWYHAIMKLADYLKQNDMRMGEFANRIGTSHATVSRYISGARQPTWKILERISAATDGAVQPQDFLRDAS